MTRHAPVLMIGLDAAELSLVEELCATGQLPALESLRLRGCFGSLESNASLFAGGVWPTFYTGKDVPWHGLYHDRLWDPDAMRCEPPREARFAERPFWELLDPDRYRIAVIDVPTKLGRPKPLNGIQLSGWAAHDLIERGSWPHSLWRGVAREFGAPKMPAENYGRQSVASLRQLKEQLLEATEQMGAVGSALVARGGWDLFLIVLGSPHRGGHYLWDLSQVERWPQEMDSELSPDKALAEIYRACDDVIARLLKVMPTHARVLVFALHGMGRNPGWSDRCADMLARIQARNGGAMSRARLPNRLNPILPRQVIRPIVARLPRSARNHLVTLWYGSMFDWQTSRCVPLSMDHAGYVRINLKGRERRGIVAPGAEYQAVCDQVKAAFLGFRDIRTGQRIAERVYHVDELAPREAPYRDTLPDLLITWGERSAIDSPGIRSDEHGEIRWEPPGLLPSGRSGNHRGQGWFVAAGEGIQPGTRADGHRLVDLVPTVYHWLGLEQQVGFQGQPIPPLCGLDVGA
jgi:predicted AlkP superfamily phosphohydrolase/phosphomutase